MSEMSYFTIKKLGPDKGKGLEELVHFLFLQKEASKLPYYIYPEDLSKAISRELTTSNYNYFVDGNKHSLINHDRILLGERISKLYLIRLDARHCFCKRLERIKIPCFKFPHYGKEYNFYAINDINILNDILDSFFEWAVYTYAANQ